MTESALLRRWPQMESIPWIGLGEYPTPVQLLDLPVAGSERLFIKRDDLTSTRYGGNKVRKLEYILAHARSRDATRVITAGAAGSHHALATTVFGNQLGFDVSLVLFPQPFTPHVRDILLADAALGAELRFAARMTGIPAGLFAARIAHWKERCQVIPPGGSDPAGTIGYVNAALELAEQITRGDAPEPDVIVVATGTMGTAAGLALGLAATDLRTRINAARITGRIVTNDRALHNLIRATATLLAQHGVHIDANAAIARIALSHDQFGEGYGKRTAAGDAATEAFSTVGLALDPTYTAKAAAELHQTAEKNPNATLLFWHTLSAALPHETTDVDQLPERFRSYVLNA